MTSKIHRSGVLTILVFVGVATTLCGRARGDDPPSVSGNNPPMTTQEAEIHLLQKEAAAQKQENDSLRSQIASLRAQLRAVGINPNADPSSRPAAAKPVRILFIYASFTSDVDKQIRQAVNGLAQDQWFNVYLLSVDKIVPYKPQFVQATDLNKQHFQKDFSGSEMNWGMLLPALTIAAKVHPDLIWVVGKPYPYDEDKFMSDLHKLYPGNRTRIDTAIDFTQHSPTELHFMWRLSHETDGICVDRDGNPMDEPAVPLSAPQTPAKPETPKPGILHDQ
jgi:hypothetical protein